MLFLIGIFTIKRQRGAYKSLKIEEYQQKTSEDEEKILFKKQQEQPILLGMFYIFLAIGFLMGFLTRFITILAEEYPFLKTMFIVQIAKVLIPDNYVSDKTIGTLENYNDLTEEWQFTIYYLLAVVSLLGFIGIVMGLRFMVMYANKSHTTSFNMFAKGVLICVLFGYTTFFPLFL